MRQNDSQPLLTRQGYPGNQAWDDYKSTIVDLYVQRKKRLQDVVRIMSDEFGFKATPAMYKKRLRRWEVYRNKKQHRLSQKPSSRLQPAPSRSLEDLPCDFRRDPGPLSTATTDSGISGMSWSSQQNANVSPLASLSGQLIEAGLPEISDWYTRPTETWYAGISEGASSDDSREIQGIDGTPEGSIESNSDGEGDGHGHISQVAPNALPTTFSVAQTSDNMHYSSHGITSWLSRGVRADSAADAHRMMPKRPSAAISRMPTPTVDPQSFINLCVEYCNLFSINQHTEAEASAIQASRVYGHLILQEHPLALTALNTVLAMALNYGRSVEAMELMGRAKVTAGEVLKTSNHPIVQTIEFLMFQAAGSYTTMQARHLQRSYDDLCAKFGSRHPYSLLTGYLLAWRLAAHDGNDLTLIHSARLLCRLQIAADMSLGTGHLLCIAIHMTKARVQQLLQLFPDAATTMNEAIRRMETKYPPRHPYVLNAKARYADILFAAYRDDEAEMEWVESALGRVELFGKDHPDSQETIMDVRGFYAATERHGQCSNFNAQVDITNGRYLSRPSIPANIAIGNPDR